MSAAEPMGKGNGWGPIRRGAGQEKAAADRLPAADFRHTSAEIRGRRTPPASTPRANPPAVSPKRTRFLVEQGPTANATLLPGAAAAKEPPQNKLTRAFWCSRLGCWELQARQSPKRSCCS